MRVDLSSGSRVAWFKLAFVVAAVAAMSPPPAAIAQDRVPLCRALPQGHWTRSSDLFYPRVSRGSGAAEAIEDYLEQHADSSHQLEEALALLRDSIAAPDSMVAVHLAWTVQHEDTRSTRIALAAFRGLRLDQGPLVQLLADYTLSPGTRWEVFRAIDTTRADSALVEAVLVSACQMSAWTAGAAFEGVPPDPYDGLLRAVTQGGAKLYVALLEFISKHWPDFRGRTGCQELASCLGPARWVYDELARP